MRGGGEKGEGLMQVHCREASGVEASSTSQLTLDTKTMKSWILNNKPWILNNEIWILNNEILDTTQ